MTLTVTNPVVWTSTTFNVENFGAKGDGVTNDTAAIQSAINAAANTPYSTVYLPTGTYLVTSSLEMYSDIRVEGEAPPLTTIVGGTANFGNDVAGLFMFNSVSNVTFQNLTMNTSQDGNNFDLDGSVSDLHVTDVNLLNLGVASYDNNTTLLSGDHIFFSGCNIEGGAMDIVGYDAPARQVFIDSTNFYGNNDNQLFHYNGGISDFAATNNHRPGLRRRAHTGWSRACGGSFSTVD